MKPTDPSPSGDRAEMPALVRDGIAGARARVPTPSQLGDLAARLPLGASAAGPATSILPSVLIGGVLGVLVAAPILAPVLAPVTRAPVAPPPVERKVAEAPAPQGPCHDGVPCRGPAPRPEVPLGRSKEILVQAAAPPTRASAVLASSAPAPTSLPRDADPGPPASGVGDALPSAIGEDEPQLLQRAHTLLAASPSAALALTAEHARRFPTGVLGQERELIAVEALVKLGQRGPAAERARRFFAAYPRSAYRSRVEALVGSPERASSF